VKLKGKGEVHRVSSWGLGQVIGAMVAFAVASELKWFECRGRGMGGSAHRWIFATLWSKHLVSMDFNINRKEVLTGTVQVWSRVGEKSVQGHRD
jgi:hypothetical protein